MSADASDTTWGPIAAPPRDTTSPRHATPSSAAFLGMSPCFGDPHHFAGVPLSIIAIQVGCLLLWLALVMSAYFSG
jgi:hypothetical protein